MLIPCLLATRNISTTNDLNWCHEGNIECTFWLMDEKGREKWVGLGWGGGVKVKIKKGQVVLIFKLIVAVEKVQVEVD